MWGSARAEEGDGLFPGFFRKTFTANGSGERLDGGCVEKEPLRLTLASECNDFDVLGLCQRLQRTLGKLSVVVTLSAK